MRLMLLEDDPTLGEGLSAYLRGEGHRVDWFTRLAEVRLLEDEPFDALLVDWNLPDGSGLDWIAALRRQGNATPIIVLTARDRLRERVQGLDSGADDYLVKPFDPEELAARVRVIGRRQVGMGQPVRRIGDVEVDLGGRAVRRGGVAVDVTAREWTVLEALVLRSGRLVAKSDLDALVHGFQGEGNSNSLEVHVYNLRRKLGRTVIETVRGLGYRVPL